MTLVEAYGTIPGFHEALFGKHWSNIICEGYVVDHIIWKTKKFKFVSPSLIVKFRIG